MFVTKNSGSTGCAKDAKAVSRDVTNIDFDVGRGVSWMNVIPQGSGLGGGLGNPQHPKVDGSSYSIKSSSTTIWVERDDIDPTGKERSYGECNYLS